MAFVLLAVIWKNLLLRRNHWIQTLIEILFPLLLLLAINVWLPPLDISNELKVDYNGYIYQRAQDLLLYSPDSSYTKPLMIAYGKKAGYKSSNVQARDFTNSTDFDLGVLFHEMNTSVMSYSIYPGIGTWPDGLPIWYEETSPIKIHGLRVVHALAEIQNMIDSLFIQNATTQKMPEINLKNMDTFSRDVDIYGFFIFMAVFFAYSFIISPVVTRVVEEKESGAKELMRMMGVTSFQLWLAKLIDALMVVLLIATGMTILLAVPTTETSVVLHNINPFYFFMFFSIGMVAVIVFLFFISCWFDTPTYAAMVAQTVGVVTVIILVLMQVSPISWWRKILYCLLPHMPLLYSIQILLKLEHYQKPVNWTERLSLDDSALALYELFVMMIIDVLIYSILTWYLDNVNPGTYGVPKSWRFFLKKSYWLTPNVATEDTAPLREGAQKRSKNGICVSQLRKVYKVSGRPSVVAVDGIDLDIPEGCITALLGHNGAGKSTTMNIITGLIPSSSGSVFINGHNIQLNPDAARRSLGLCPQKDLLFRDLTALQTLLFFGLIKGMSYGNACKEAKSLLKSMKMDDAKDREAKDLSGGMKRKLSLAIAIIGNSKVLILDEPTSGVDPELRREICDLLLSYRGERTILLTTHIMEEADAISDYIFIMDHGKVQCSGTPLDLKTRFGTGYTLQIVVQDVVEQELVDTILELVNGSRFKARNAATVVFQLPSVETSSFPKLFDKLDYLQSNGGIASYSVSISTLEDVFVRVRELKENEQKQSSDEIDGTPYCLLASNTQLNVTKYYGVGLIMRQLYAQFIKKFLIFIRSYRRFIIFVCIPLALFSTRMAPALSKMVVNGDKNYTMFFNYSSPMYEGMEIFYSKALNCSFCESFEKSLKTVTNEKGFTLTEVNNVTDATHKTFINDFHYYSRYLALAFDITSENITIVFNSQAVHIINVAINILNNAWLGQYGQSFDIKTATNLSLAEKQSRGEVVISSSTSVESSLPDFLGIQTLYYIAELQTEKLQGAKSLQLLATPAWLYWISHLLFDIGTFCIYALLSSIIYYLVDPTDEIFQNGYDFAAAIILWGAGMILISYLVACITKTKANSISIALLIYYVFSFFLWALVSSFLVPSWVTYLHPTMIWKIGFSKGDHMYLLYLAVYVVVFFSFLVLIESALINRIAHSLFTLIRKIKYDAPDETDLDVTKEAQLVAELVKAPTNVPNTLLASQLKRWYGLIRPKVAVRGVSFRVVPGECFGLLGVNGAGKSSTFNMLTGQISCSEGDVYLNDSKISAMNREKYLSQVGYCPQASGIIPDLEGKEFLELFCRLRGYRESQIAETTEAWIKILDLQDCAGKQCCRYSGGMERKLSAAAAFLWDANVVMLDEPTSGVDPVARRSIWKAVTTAQENGKSVLLTSHSMDECEALCSRLAIMVDGHFKCLGETTKIKKKYGGGYSVQLKLTAAGADDIARFQTAVMESFGEGCRLTDLHSSILHYHIKNNTTTWKSLFSKLEMLKKDFTIFESYMASETTLEQIFLAFAGTRGTKETIRCIDIV